MNRLNDFVRDFFCSRTNELYLACKGCLRMARPACTMAPSIMQFMPGKVLGNWSMKVQVPRQWLITRGATTNSDRKLSLQCSKRFSKRDGPVAVGKTVKLRYKI